MITYRYVTKISLKTGKKKRIKLMKQDRFPGYLLGEDGVLYPLGYTEIVYTTEE